MALTKTQISELYVSIFNRASEKSGSQNWLNSGYNTDAKTMANAMLATDAAKTYFGTSLDSNAAFVEHIYANTLNKGGATVDAAGKAGWVEFLETGKSKGEMVAKMIEAIKEYQVGGAKYATADQTTKDAAQQFANRVEVSDYTADTLETIAVSDINSTLSFSSALTVTANPATVETAKKSVQALTIDGTTFSLTASATGDTFIGTEKSDLFNATTLNSLQNNDVLLDSTTTDSDILNAAVTTANVAARIQNIETINVTGEYVTTGLALTNVSGAKTLNLDTKLAGGTATVTDANSINAAAIKAGANISTLDVTSLSSGTRDTVTVDGGSANVKLTGNTGGADKYSVTIAKDKTLTANAMASSGDELTVNASNNFTLTTGAAIATATINNTGSAAITVTATGTADIATKLNLSGNAVTLKGDADAFAGTTAIATGLGVEVTSTATKSTIELSGATAPTTVFLNKAQVSEVLVNAVITAPEITVNENSKLVLAKGQTTSVTADVQNAKGDLAAGKGTLLLDVNASQTKIITGANAGTVLLTAGKLDNDANGKAQTVTIADLDTNATATTVDTIVVNGANDLIISKLTGTANELISATAHTGKLTINDFTEATKVFSGSNNDTFKVTTGTGKVLEISSGAGNDTVDLSASTVANKINLGEGDDTITTGAGANEITLGAGKDTVIIGSTKNGAIIADAVIGQDKIILTGAATAGTAVNVAALGTITAGSYATAFGANHAFILTGSTASDLSGLVQFGKQAVAATATTAAVAEAAYTAAVNVALTTGSFNDVVSVAASSGNINLGAGDDKIIVTGAQTGKITGGAGSDTFEIGANATITDLGATDILKVTAGTVSVDVVESFTATAATTNAATTTTLNLKDGVNVDMTLATLTASANGYTITTDAAVTKGATIVGSRAADVITGSKFADKITGGEGADTITAGAGADTIILTESVSTADIVRIDTIAESVTSANFKTIHNFVSTVDKINFKQGAGSLTGVTTDGTGDAVATMAAVVTNTTAVNSIADIYTALATYTTLTASAADGTATIAQAYTFANGTAAGTYVVVNDATIGFQAATDVVIQLTGTTTIAAGDFTFTA